MSLSTKLVPYLIELLSVYIPMRLLNTISYNELPANEIIILTTRKNALFADGVFFLQKIINKYDIINKEMIQNE